MPDERWQNSNEEDRLVGCTGENREAMKAVMDRVMALTCREVEACGRRCNELNSVVIRRRSITYELEDAIPIELGCTAERWPLKEASYEDIYSHDYGWRLRAGPKRRGIQERSRNSEVCSEALITPSFGLCPAGSDMIVYRKPTRQRRQIRLEKCTVVRDALTIAVESALSTKETCSLDYFFPLLELHLDDNIQASTVRQVILGAQLKLELWRDPPPQGPPLHLIHFIFPEPPKYSVTMTQLGGPSLAISRFHGFPLKDIFGYIHRRWSRSPRLYDPSSWAVLALACSPGQQHRPESPSWLAASAAAANKPWLPPPSSETPHFQNKSRPAQQRNIYHSSSSSSDDEDDDDIDDDDDSYVLKQKKEEEDLFLSARAPLRKPASYSLADARSSFVLPQQPPQRRRSPGQFKNGASQAAPPSRQQQW